MICMSKGDIAKQNFMNGYNCSQAVLLAFCEDFGLEKETALKISEPFGGGMGRMREVCGTVTGMFMVIGLAMGNDNSKDNTTKKNVYKSVQELAAKFKEDNGSIICRELLGFRKTIRKVMCRPNAPTNTIKSVLVRSFASMRQIFLKNILRKKTSFKQLLLYKIYDFDELSTKIQLQVDNSVKPSYNIVNLITK